MQKKLRLVLLACALALAGWPAAKMLTRWFTMRVPELLDVDYTLYLASSLQGLRAGWHKLYDLEAQYAVYGELGVNRTLPSVYTPAMSMLMVPFTWLSIDHGFRLWSILLLASLVICWRLLAPGDPPARAVMLAMVFVPYPVTLGLMEGQVIALQIGLIAISFALLLRGREIAAGVLLSMIALKPQGVLLLPFALLAAGKRRAFVSWAAAMAVIGAAALALIGIDGARAYAGRLAYASERPHEFMVSWSYTLALHFQSAAGRTAILLAAASAALLAAFRHRGTPELIYAAGIVGSILVSPYLHLYDMMLLFPAAWLVLRVVPARFAAPPLLIVYGLMLLCTHAGTGLWGRWVLLGECVWLAALALAPRFKLSP